MPITGSSDRYFVRGKPSQGTERTSEVPPEPVRSPKRSSTSRRWIFRDGQIFEVKPRSETAAPWSSKETASKNDRSRRYPEEATSYHVPPRVWSESRKSRAHVSREYPVPQYDYGYYDLPRQSPVDTYWSDADLTRARYPSNSPYIPTGLHSMGQSVYSIDAKKNRRTRDATVPPCSDSPYIRTPQPEYVHVESQTRARTHAERPDDQEDSRSSRSKKQSQNDMKAYPLNRTASPTRRSEELKSHRPVSGGHHEDRCQSEPRRTAESFPSRTEHSFPPEARIQAMEYPSIAFKLLSESIGNATRDLHLCSDLYDTTYRKIADREDQRIPRHELLRDAYHKQTKLKIACRSARGRRGWDDATYDKYSHECAHFFGEELDATADRVVSQSRLEACTVLLVFNSAGKEVLYVCVQPVDTDFIERILCNKDVFNVSMVDGIGLL